MSYDLRTLRDAVVEKHYAELIRNAKGLNKYEAKFFSQHGEDGIIAEIFKRIGTTNKTFFEFGAGIQFENNSLYLLLNGWNGFWIDGDKKYVEFNAKHFKKYVDDGKLKLSDHFISSENINSIAKGLGVPKDLDFLSIDIDGNDYYIWKACDLKPRVLCIEINPRFNYDSEYVQDENNAFGYPTHFSGSSFKAMADLSKKKGYTLVATDLSGVNAFFVRNEDKDKFDNLDMKDMYNPSRAYLQFYKFS
jgi:hypothetical protein